MQNFNSEKVQEFSVLSRFAVETVILGNLSIIHFGS